MVQLAPEAAAAVRSGEPAPTMLREAEDMLRSLGLTMEPLHTGTEDLSLASWFRVAVEDDQTAEEVATALRASPAVESAYVEPPSAPPG
jgi:hypothetical protein